MRARPGLVAVAVAAAVAAPAGAAVREVPVRVPAPGGALAGALALPSGPGPHPALVLVAGFGPDDRDGIVLPGPWPRPYGAWARALAARGVAVLRYDKPGLGASPGPATAWLDRDRLTGAARAAVAALRRMPGVDARRVGLLGHSQGGSIALVVGRRARAWRVVTFAAPGRPFDRSGDPAAQAAALRAPALLVQGTADTTVRPAEVALLAAARRRAGRPTAVLRVPGADHHMAAGGRVPPGVWARVARFARGGAPAG